MQIARRYCKNCTFLDPIAVSHIWNLVYPFKVVSVQFDAAERYITKLKKINLNCLANNYLISSNNFLMTFAIAPL